MNAIQWKGHPSIRAAIRAYRVDHPKANAHEIAAALELDHNTVYDALRLTNAPQDRPSGVRRRGGDKEERRLKLLPMLDGPGERHEDCAGYEDCLMVAARLDGEAHCPRDCQRYVPEPHDVKVARGMVARESDSGIVSHLRPARVMPLW